MNKVCPGCGTPFNVTPQDDGKRFACFKCNSALVVTRTGIQLEGPPPGLPPAPAPVVDVAPLPAPPPSGPAPAPRPARPRLGRLLNVVDGPTWLFGLGAWLVILFLFFPLINQAKIKRADAARDVEKNRVDRLERDLKQKEKEGKSLTLEEQERRKKTADAWIQKKDSLEDDIKDVEIDAKRSDYWYRWGMMFGFLILAVAALGYLDPRQPTIRRVVGAVVLVAEVLLIFLKFIFDKV